MGVSVGGSAAAWTGLEAGFLVFAGVGVGVEVGVRVGVKVGVGVGLGVKVAVRRGVKVKVGRGVLKGVGVRVGACTASAPIEQLKLRPKLTRPKMANGNPKVNFW